MEGWFFLFKVQQAKNQVMVGLIVIEPVWLVVVAIVGLNVEDAVWLIGWETVGLVDEEVVWLVGSQDDRVD